MPKKKMSTAAYNMYILGAFTKTLRSLMFNLLVFFVGLSIGMGFSILHMQRAWKERYAHDTISKLEKALAKRGIADKEFN